MRYAVLTARHHDGFALWDSAANPWNAARIGPRRDIVAAFLDAFRREGLRVGLYFSFADWTHPDYPDPWARDWPTAWRDDASRGRFVADCAAQLREILTGYGAIDMLWWDGCFPAPTGGEALNRLAKSLQPEILINNRNGGDWDFHCCEQTVKPAPEGTNWEACMTLNRNWGFHAGDDRWKSAGDIIGLLLETSACGGNLLLNVGPRADGLVPEPCAQAIREAGAWLRANGEFLPGSGRSPFGWFHSGKLTVRGTTAWLHLLHSTGGTLTVAEIANRVLSARVVANGREIPFQQDAEGRLTLSGLPEPGAIAATIALDLDGPPRALRAPTDFWVPQ